MNKEIDVLTNFYNKCFLYGYIKENPHVKVMGLSKCPNYYICSDGNIYSVRCDKFLKPQTHNSQGWYHKVKINYDGIVRNLRVHRLVAEAFIPNPDDLPEVDHINHNRGDNRLENLRWISRKDNMNNLKCHSLKKNL